MTVSRRMMSRRLPQWIARVLLLAFFALAVTWVATRAANHYGFMLPGQSTLPDHLFYGGRYYQRSECWTEDFLQSVQSWPLHQTGAIPVLFGSARPILTSRVPKNVPRGLAPTIVFVPWGRDCYEDYGLEGGP